MLDWADPDEILNGTLSTTTPAPTTSNNDGDYYSGLAGRASSISGVPKDWILAQWKHETGNFTSPLTAENNFGGLTQETSNDMKQPDGRNYYMRFNTPEEYADYFGRYLKLYKEDGVLDAKTPEEYATALHRGGYYTDDPANYIAGLKTFGATTVRDGATNTSWLNDIDPDKLLSVSTPTQPATTEVPLQAFQMFDMENSRQPEVPLVAFQAYDMEASKRPDIPLQAFQMADIEATSAMRPKADINNVDYAGTIPVGTDGKLLEVALNTISSTAEAADNLKTNANKPDAPWWQQAIHNMYEVTTAPASTGLTIINQFARPEAALGTLTQHVWDVMKGNKTQDPNALSAAWRGFITNESDTTKMFKELGMSDTQAFWANLGRQVIADPLIIGKPVLLIEKANKAAKWLGVSDKVMPIVAKMASTDVGQRIATLRDFVMGNKPTAELLAQMERAKAGDIYKAEFLASDFKKLQKGLNPDQLHLLNKAQQATNDVLPITPVANNVAIDIVDMFKNPNNNPYGTLPDAIKAGAIRKEDAIASFLQQGEEVPRFLLDDRQWNLYQEAIKANKNAPATILVPDAIKRSEYLDKLQQSGVRPEVIQQADALIDAWQQFNHTRFQEPLLQRGHISDETFVRMMDGTYLKRAYEAYGTPEKYYAGVIKNGTAEERMIAGDRLQQIRDAKKGGNKNTIPLSELIMRENLSEETMKKMGLITNAEYNIMNSVKGSSNVLRASEYLENVGGAFGKTRAEIEALETATPGARSTFTQLNGKQYGKLDGMYVPNSVADDVRNVADTKLPENKIWEIWQKAITAFKIEKLLDIPPIFRNFYSGIPMANVFGDVGLIGKNGSPLLGSVVNVAKDLFSHARGSTNTLFDKAKEIGLLDSTWTRKEAEALLNYEGEFMKAGAVDKLKWLADKGMTAFSAPDQFWRLVVFDHWLKQGKTEIEAANIAKRALLDYSKAPTWVSMLAKSGAMPFARFPWLAGVETARALYNRPASVTKYTKPFKGEEAEDRNKVLPKYLKGKELLPMGTSTRTIEGKETKVQENLDMNYILPFFNEFYLGNPLTELATIWGTGKSSTGMTLIRPNMTPEDKAKAYGKYVRDSFGPAITASYGWPAKLMGAYNQEVDYKGRMYSPKDAALQVIGLKNVPINYQSEVDKRELEMRGQAKDIKAEMRRIEREYERKVITKEQRNISLGQYERELGEIDRKYFEMRKAFKRFKPITK